MGVRKRLGSSPSRTACSTPPSDASTGANLFANNAVLSIKGIISTAPTTLTGNLFLSAGNIIGASSQMYIDGLKSTNVITQAGNIYMSSGNILATGAWLYNKGISSTATVTVGGNIFVGGERAQELNDDDGDGAAFKRLGV